MSAIYVADIKTGHMKQHKISHSWFSNRNSLYEHHVTCDITLTSISSEVQKLPKYDIFVDVSIHPLIDCELCHQCFALPCECVQMEIMMKAEKGELKHWKYLMKEYNICTIKCVHEIWDNNKSCICILFMCII